jgi:hypothetical protein
MGSFSSGRHRTANRGAIEDTDTIDMRRLNRLGLVRAGESRSTFWRWSRRGEVALVSVDLTNLANGALRIDYWGLVPFSQRVLIVAQPCRYGGHRFYFLCPITWARVEVLALDGARFISRKAAHLSYASQSETELHRLDRASAKAEARACGKDGYPRPRGQNRERLFVRWCALEEVADDLVEAEVSRRLGGVL